METESDLAHCELQVWTSTSCSKYHREIEGGTMMMFPSLLFLWREGYGDRVYNKVEKDTDRRYRDICEKIRHFLFAFFSFFSSFSWSPL
jgi:hypothetical protein